MNTVNVQKSAQWKAMIKDTILKEMRSKTLIFIFIATTLMILLANSVLKMFMTQDASTNIMINGSTSLSYMFRAINAWNVIVAGVFGISAVRSDFREKIIYQYLSFPISRTQYMFSRIFGAWILVFSYYVYSYLLATILFSIATHSFALGWGHLLSMAMMGIYVFLVIFISFFYSLFAGKIGSFLLLIATVFTISVSAESVRYLAFNEYLKEAGLFRLIGLIVYAICPRINYISEVANSVMFKEEIKLNLGLEALHLVVTSALLIFIADRVMKRKNF